MKKTGKLKNWRFDHTRGCLVGNLIADGRFDDGEIIRTSAIESIVVTTKNTIYHLSLEDMI